jgi:hypothetical protein
MDFMNSDNLYSVVFDEHNQAVVFTGNMRPKCREELMDVTRTMLMPLSMFPVFFILT